MEPLPEFSIQYKWAEASVPPPFHYEYIIEADLKSGKITFFPDYAQHYPPVWVERFNFTLEKWVRLYEVIDIAQFFRPRWSVPTMPHVGGATRHLQVSRQGQIFRLPFELDDRDRLTLEPVFAAIQDLVPQAVWNKLLARKDAYRKE